MPLSDFEDIIRGPDNHGTPWRRGGRDIDRGVDCAGLALEVLRRLGKNVTAEDVWLDPDLDAGDERWAELLAAHEGRYEKLGTTWKDATLDGDIVVAASPDGSTRFHVYVIVDAATRTTLTTTIKTGATAFPLRLATAVLAVYRLTDAPSHPDDTAGH